MIDALILIFAIIIAVIAVVPLALAMWIRDEIWRGEIRRMTERSEEAGGRRKKKEE